jgi:hypothetical protein
MKDRLFIMLQEQAPGRTLAKQKGSVVRLV